MPEIKFIPYEHRHLGGSDSFVTSFFVTTLIHAFIIFGVGFTIAPPINKPPAQTLDIVLVKTRADVPPENPDYLAQANQKGGGTLEKKAKITSQAPGEAPQQGNALQNRPDTSPVEKQQPVPDKSVLTAERPSKLKAEKLEKEKKTVKPVKPLTENYLSELQQKIVDMEAELDKKKQQYSKRPKATYITASTREAPAAMYLKQWTRKIERIGNLNYPDKARRDKLSGSLILAVSLNPAGEVIAITIRQSSGHQVLDDAAKRIVELAAPFAPVPEDVLQGNNTLIITRTWRFTHTSGTLSTH